MSFVRKFLDSEKSFPLLTGLAAGLYPMLFYYSNNFSLINSWGHFRYFLMMFLLLPIFGIFLLDKITKGPKFDRYRKYLIPFLNLFIFLFLMKVCLYGGLQKKMIVVIGLVSIAFAYFLYKHYKKVVVFQLLLAVIGIYTFTNTMISQLNFSDEWKQPVDDIAEVTLRSKPNIYYIQPDGYVNFSELKKGYYHYDNSSFEHYLTQNGFTHYDDFRTNYASTLSSNSSAFMMKHHYYNNGLSFSEGIDARETIISDNTVLRLLKRNGYKTYFISEAPYLMVNRPKMGYDYTNFSYDDISYLSTGFREKGDVVEDLSSTLLLDRDHPKFYFIEFFNPGHIEGTKEKSEGREKERELWLESLERANEKLKLLISEILEKDPNALILMMGDHGGFVGMDYTHQIYVKTQERDLVHSIFSSQLSIRWPEGTQPEEDPGFQSSVNVFRILFAHLSGETKYLEKLQPDESYVIINEGAPKGIYKYIDDAGNIVFEKH
jgi:Sulfatase